MIQHIVFFKWKADAKPDAIAAVKAAVAKLAEIPGVTGLMAGDNFAPAFHHDFGFGFSLNVPDAAGLEVYRVHPLHMALAPLGRAQADDIFVADIAG